jgi:hypothetical protein
MHTGGGVVGARCSQPLFLGRPFTWCSLGMGEGFQLDPGHEASLCGMRC